ncbi:hypothetical protein ACFE04_022639 [Oxalis oulophora]
MFSSNELPSPSSLLSPYASIAAYVMLFRSMTKDFFPPQLTKFLRSLFFTSSKILTLIFDERTGMSGNQIFKEAEIYLSTKISHNADKINVCKTFKQKNLMLRLETGEKVVDVYKGIKLTWMFVCSEPDKQNSHSSRTEKRCYQLTFDKRHEDFVMNNYLPFVLETAKFMTESERVLNMYTLESCGSNLCWDSVALEHPSTFETLALEPDLKKALMSDLDRFVARKEFYKKVGRAWKRGYLFYGPPGTGKSSLVAAMANYLKFDVYDLQLANIMSDSDLRKVLLSSRNQSILVIEDIDCSANLPVHRSNSEGSKKQNAPLTLSGLLNFIDGLWSICGDERIIIFTTNHKERLDPALLRPGRMDMHVHMSYIKPQGFRSLAANYLDIKGHHPLFNEIDSLLENNEITPAQVAEEFMKSEDPDGALQGVVNLLKEKRLESGQTDGDPTEANGKNRKVEN